MWLDDLLTERGHDTRLHIIIEMNAGLEAVFDIARSSARIDALFFGVDMAADLRCKNAWEPLLYARSRVVHAAASVGVDAVDVPYLDLEDLEGMKIQARQARDLGFSGKGAIHPKQIADLNEVFTPSGEEVARARKVVAAFEDANTGLVVVDGKLIEKARGQGDAENSFRGGSRGTPGVKRPPQSRAALSASAPVAQRFGGLIKHAAVMDETVQHSGIDFQRR